MPDVFAGGCFFWEIDPFFPRPDMPKHAFTGANTWVLPAVHALYGEQIEGLTPELVQSAVQRNIATLQAASDMELSQVDDLLNVRITNYSGHKLPTGYPEGRRMWINVRFFDDGDELLAEHGAYDFDTAELETDDTKVYEARHGIDEAVAEQRACRSGPCSTWR